MNENESREMEMNMMESEKENALENYESSGNGSLAAVIAGAALFAGGIAVSKIVGAVKNRKKNEDKPKKKRKKLMWVEVDEESEDVYEEFDPEEFEEEEPEKPEEEKK